MKRVKRISGILLSALLVFGVISQTGIPEKSEVTAVDLEAQVPLTLSYDEPAESWESEALPLGNGFIGAMLFGGVGSDRIQVNEHTLWSGGPGANQNYNGGNEIEKTDVIHSTLTSVRNTLQNKMTDFTNNRSAYISGGNIVTSDYSDEDGALKASIEGLMGTKNNFGDYQTLGNIMIFEPGYEDFSPNSVSTNAEPSNKNEAGAMMFDNNLSTKWYADGYPNVPYNINWSYAEPKTINSYNISSANDMPDRDPKDWILYGSNDGSSYTALDTRSGVNFEERQQTKNFVPTNGRNQAYKYYRLVISSVKTAGNSCQISEIEVVQQEKTANYSNYKRTLDLDNAVASVSYADNDNGCDMGREYFISNPDNVMAIKLTAGAKGRLNRTVSIASEQTNKTVTANNDTITMTGSPADHGANGLKFAQQIRVVATGGTTVAENGNIKISGADEIIIYMTAGTNYQQCMDNSFDFFKDGDPLTEVSARIRAAVSKGYNRLKEEHIADYSSLYGRVKVNFGATEKSSKMTDDLLSAYNRTNSVNDDCYLESLYYQYGRYLLIASSREGSLPANLQGIWAEGLTNPWNSDYHTNINLQMNYWLAETTNLAECHEPLIDYINSLVERGKITAKTYYVTEDGREVRGWVTNHENNIWAHTAPSNYYMGFYFPTAAAWLCQDIYEYYKFNNDEQFMRENYDTMMSAALFWVDNLWTDKRDGSLVSNPSYSPEHGVYSLGASCDQEIIYELFREVIEISEDLNLNTPEVQEVRNAMNKLYLPKIGLSGKLLEWKDETTMDVTGDNQHRHANHLFMLYPGSQISVGRSTVDDQYAAAAKSVLNTRGDGGTGWSKAWKICFWARLHDGERAHTLVEQLFASSTLDNLFDTHPPFQIDGNFGAVAGMNEMLIQSQDDVIQILPALPDSWSTGKISGVKARGDFELSIGWQDSVANVITLSSGSGSDCTLKYKDIANKTVVNKTTGQSVEFTRLSNDEISFKTTAETDYEIVDEYEGAVDLTVTSVSVSPSTINDGDNFKAYATIRNLSESSTALPVKVEFSYDGRIFETVTYENSISAGGLAIISVTTDKSIYFGSHSVIAKIVGDNTDTDTANNRLKSRYKVNDL